LPILAPGGKYSKSIWQNALFHWYLLRFFVKIGSTFSACRLLAAGGLPLSCPDQNYSGDQPEAFARSQKPN
jgi:hypothetical protein